jgi:hypothetical protein
VIRSVTPGDSSGPLIPNGPGNLAPARWHDIAPELSAGLAHDHLFVGWEQGERARALLSQL